MKKVISARRPLGFDDGFTLIELMLGVALLGVLLAIGIPSFGDMMRTNRLASQVNEFTATLNFARSEAYKRGLPVVVCVANNDVTDCSTTASWSNGWLAYVDTNRNGTYQTGGTEPILMKVSAPGGNLTYTPNPVGQRTMTFSPLSASPGNFQLDIFKSGCTGLEKRRITVLSTGRIKMQKVDCSLT